MIYCFEITKDKQKLFLTSHSDCISVGKIDYLPYSGLIVDAAELNDSGTNKMIISGIFEDEGISRTINILDAEIKVMKYSTRLDHWLTGYCKKMERDEGGFKIHLGFITDNLNKALVDCYSKTCRAEFGDKKCGVKKKEYEMVLQVKEVINNRTLVTDCDKPTGYFNLGEVVIKNIISASEDGDLKKEVENKFRIISQIGPLIELDRAPMKIPNQIIAIPGCDKQFSTCCNKFHNAINFRGEPFLHNE